MKLVVTVPSPLPSWQHPVAPPSSVRLSRRRCTEPAGIDPPQELQLIVTAIDRDGKRIDFKLARTNRYHLESPISDGEQEGYPKLHSGRHRERIPCSGISFEVTDKQ